jgi:hypothetical protein
MPSSRGRGLGLKFLQWFIRAVQLASAIIILGIYIYFLVTLHDHNLSVPTSVRAVTGIAGAAVVYTGIALLLLCCLAGLPFTSFIAIVLDVGFLGAFIYVAVANKNGASQCTGQVNTVFGSGADGEEVEGQSGKFTQLPNLHIACKLETACLAIAIIQVYVSPLRFLSKDRISN